MRACLSWLRKAEKLSKSVIDGWDLIHVGLSAVRELSPNAWVTSFKRVNLHPESRVPFPEYCVRISRFLHGGENFKPDTMFHDTYNLLPGWWHGMAPTEKRRCFEILQSHDNKYSKACVLQLHDVMHIPITDMQNLRVCLELCSDHPEHLDRELPQAVPAAEPLDVVVAAQASVGKITDGLTSFQLHPTIGGKQMLSGLAKFEHMVQLTRRSTPITQLLKPSSYLDIEFTAGQQKLLDPTPQDFMMHEIMSHSHGVGAQQALAKRKLDSLGNLRGTSGLANDAARLKRMRAQLELAGSLAEISKARASDDQGKKMAATRELTELAPAAITKLKCAGLDVQKITKKEMVAIAFTAFGGIALSLSEPKPTLADKLTKLMQEQPGVIGPATMPEPLGEPAPKRKRNERVTSNPEPDSDEDDDDSGEEDSGEVGSGEEDSAEEDSGEEASGEEDSDAAAAAASNVVDSSDEELPAVKCAKVKMGRSVHVPHSAFPDEEEPELGYWIGKTVRCKSGGDADIGIKIPGEQVFTWPLSEVAAWVV